MSILLIMARRNRLLLNLIHLLWRTGKRYPWFWLFSLIISGGWYAYEVKIARPQMSYQGVPVAQEPAQPMTWFRVFRNDGFMLGYSDLRGNPLWVTYQLTPLSQTQSLQRPGRFSEDWRSLNRIKHDDYTGSGYDRGHLAPNHAISQLYGREAQLDTFLMTNITPQKPKLNQKFWQRLESVEIDHFTRLGAPVWVITGPVFTGSTERLKSSWKVEIPDQFYKIYAMEKQGQVQMLAFLVPQNVKGRESLSRYVVSVDEIEKLTGLDFFQALDDRIENAAEASTDVNAWKLKSVANLPPRY
jgi:endonuclease G